MKKIDAVECKEDYIGQNELNLKNNMKIHSQQYETPAQDILLSGDLDLCATNKCPKFQVFPLYPCQDNTTDTKKKKHVWTTNTENLSKTIHT